MSYESAVLDGLFVLRWGKNPAPVDVENYAREAAEARRTQGKPLIGLFIMPPDSAAPDDKFRRAQATKLPEIMAQFSYAVCVFEGEGFMASLKRSALVAILLIAPKHYPVYVRSSVEEALITKPPKRIEFDPVLALRELKRRGLVVR